MLAHRTGMTATQVVEEALRAYLPPVEGEGNALLVRKGAVLVTPGGGNRVSLGGKCSDGIMSPPSHCFLNEKQAVPGRGRA